MVEVPLTQVVRVPTVNIVEAPTIVEVEKIVAVPPIVEVQVDKRSEVAKGLGQARKAVAAEVQVDSVGTQTEAHSVRLPAYEDNKAEVGQQSDDVVGLGNVVLVPAART